MSLNNYIGLILYLILSPFIGGLLSGADRIITARMQSRVGPPILQPFYDVLKLFKKENLVVRRSQNFYIFFYLLFVIFTGALFFSGGDLLLFVFAVTLAGIFFVLGSFKSSSPYSFVGAQRELIQMMAYEPILLLSAIGLYQVTKSFQVSDIIKTNFPIIIYLPGIFFGYIFCLTIKLRKSPFDLSTSHHAHQEIVKGVTTEFSGKTLAMIEIAHWYENVFLLGIVYLFFASSPVIGVALALAAYFFEILIDNTYARFKWLYTIKSSWIITLVFGMGNIIILYIFFK